MKTKLSSSSAKEVLWYRGVLKWKLDDNQKELYDLFYENKDKISVWLLARRSGKTFALCCIAIEQCLKKPNSVVKFVAPQKAMIRTIVRPIIRIILEDCPKDLRPEFKTQESLYRFHNGSEIQLGGTDSGNAETLRGGFADLCIVDEAGFCDDLGYVVNSILMPTTLTTKGKVILSSTPSKVADHEFNKFKHVAEDKGKLIKKTIYDNRRLTQEDIDETIESYPGGAKNPEFRREYLCEEINDLDKSVVPEFTDELAAQIVKEWPKPSHYDSYTVADPGGKDLTAALFAYYDFKNGKLVIVDEFATNNPEDNTEKLAGIIKEKEKTHWGDKYTGEYKTPMRYIDNNNQIFIRDLYSLHGLVFNTTAKDDKLAAVNNMRIMLSKGQIVIDPRCKTLIRHLKRATWNKQKTSYERSAENGHYDLIDCLVYLCRNVNLTKNPYPAQTYDNNWFVPPGTNGTKESLKHIKRIFKR